MKRRSKTKKSFLFLRLPPYPPPKEGKARIFWFCTRAKRADEARISARTIQSCFTTRSARETSFILKIGSSVVKQTHQYSTHRLFQSQKVGRAKRVPLVSPCHTKRIQRIRRACAHDFVLEEEVRNQKQF